MCATRWEPALETGYESIDAQHRSLFELVAEFEEAGDEDVPVLVLAERIMEHVDVHFATEEALMRTSGYPAPELAEHTAEHARLRNRARDMVIAIREGRGVLRAQFVDYLCDWLIEHTLSRDRALVEFLRAGSANEHASAG